MNSFATTRRDYPRPTGPIANALSVERFLFPRLRFFSPELRFFFPELTPPAPPRAPATFQQPRVAQEARQLTPRFQHGSSKNSTACRLAQPPEGQVGSAKLQLARVAPPREMASTSSSQDQPITRNQDGSAPLRRNLETQFSRAASPTSTRKTVGGAAHNDCTGRPGLGRLCAGDSQSSLTEPTLPTRHEGLSERRLHLRPCVTPSRTWHGSSLSSSHG